MTTLKAIHSNLHDFKEDLYSFNSFDSFYVETNNHIISYFPRW